MMTIKIKYAFLPKALTWKYFSRKYCFNESDWFPASIQSNGCLKRVFLYETIHKEFQKKMLFNMTSKKETMIL